MLNSFEVIGAGVFALLGAALIVGGMARWLRPMDAGPAEDRVTVFLFSGESLIDATPEAWRLLQTVPRGSDLGRLIKALAPRFGAGLGARLAAVPTSGRDCIPATGSDATLDVERDGPTLRLTFRDTDSPDAALDRLRLASAEQELGVLRGVAEDAPHPIWAVDDAGGLCWANRAYLDLSDRMAGAAPAGAAPGTDVTALWPRVPLLPRPEDLAEGESRHERRSLALPGRSEPLWLDVTSVRRGGTILQFGLDVKDLVLAESARVHFVQALAKTFAHLSTGLAIFDRERRLAMFNPAFLDMTGLPAAFLSARPLVQAVLDRLRDAKVLPEPRDYGAWREDVLAAAEGLYCETWTLPDGQTWRVTGRPHPEGALAFLFVDITAEVGLTRVLRGEIDVLRAAIDSFDAAMAIFAPTGALQARNAAYDALWGTRDAGALDLRSELLRWERTTGPSPIWPALRDATGPSRVAEATLLHPDAHGLRLRATPLPRGALVVAFRPDPATEGAQPAAATVTARPLVAAQP